MKPAQIVLSLFGSLSLLSTGIAEAQLSPTVPLQFVPPAAPERGRPPGRRQGGASRGGCHIASQPPLTAMVPFNLEPTLEATNREMANSSAAVTDKEVSRAAQSSGSQSAVFSLTTQAHPSFWFYVPYSLETTPLEFVLQDENNNTLYQERVSVEAFESQLQDSDSEGGIVQVALPDSAPALESGRTYRWFFMAYCDADNPSYVEGSVMRSPLADTAADALTTATTREQASFYAQNGIWQEALTVWAEHYKENQANAAISNDWESLLESANLGHLTGQPLMCCCSVE